mmetsp:Transcript_29966/g.78598  ORF Transcript_29966/g.78598 Transcript_29966/m.78598 type:complete len:228 (+) Transcript_29966:132-815(+)
MADDLDVDALLEDLDVLCAGRSVSPPVAKPAATRSAAVTARPEAALEVTAKSTSTRGGSVDDELQDVLDELDISIDEDKSTATPSATVARSAPVAGRAAIASAGHAASALGGARCEVAMLGGSALPTGLGTRSCPKACNMLRCIKCDFKVCWFEDASWHPRSDYLFFRNGCTDPVKLKPNLVPTKGSRAYACQCAWTSVLDATAIAAVAQEKVDKKWRCLPGAQRHP